MTKMDEIKGRTLGARELARLAAIEGAEETALRSQVMGATKTAPTIKVETVTQETDKETEYIGNIALGFYNEFKKLGVEEPGQLTIAACILKSNALIAIAIRDKK